MAFDLPTLRIASYAILALFSFITFGLTIGRLNYTDHLPRGDTLNHGRDFYDPDIVELLITSMMSIVWAIYVIRAIHRRVEDNLVSTFRGELIGLFIVWMFWLVGTAIATVTFLTQWGSLGFCQEFEACRVLSAIVAFSWLCWVSVSFNFGVSITFILANGALLEPLHGQWAPGAGDQESQYKERSRQSRPVSAGPAA
ncbi:hypothetical protein B0H17DRAFT_1023114 [Mycena rosella]|uniref:MARVEL domain-containing protein n=1 Tax=Mycena rosella TaxID=1033263 RepID=A0AAD7C6S7_MYCRO|nr:hypothetical protein B0H17DRAFT_1023114 [Mycena rosella]